jgi:uncharacterized protein
VGRGAVISRPGLIVVTLLLAACSSPPLSYEDELLQARAEKDRMLRESADSPIRPEQRRAWPPLEYYPPDPAYRVPAQLVPAPPDAQTITMPTSTGQQRQMRRAGTLQFSVKGEPLKLSAFFDLDSKVARRLFVPFVDLTSGKETYPGGRYLDLDPTRTGLYEIDFNYAYSPYCAYNEDYDCPFPPPENRLPAEIRAGEKYSIVANDPRNPTTRNPTRSNFKFLPIYWPSLVAENETARTLGPWMRAVAGPGRTQAETEIRPDRALSGPVTERSS